MCTSLIERLDVKHLQKFKEFEELKESEKSKYSTTLKAVNEFVEFKKREENKG